MSAKTTTRLSCDATGCDKWLDLPMAEGQAEWKLPSAWGRAWVGNIGQPPNILCPDHRKAIEAMFEAELHVTVIGSDLAVKPDPAIAAEADRPEGPVRCSSAGCNTVLKRKESLEQGVCKKCRKKQAEPMDVPL